MYIEGGSRTKLEFTDYKDDREDHGHVNHIFSHRKFSKFQSTRRPCNTVTAFLFYTEKFQISVNKRPCDTLFTQLFVPYRKLTKFQSTIRKIMWYTIKLSGFLFHTIFLQNFSQLIGGKCTFTTFLFHKENFQKFSQSEDHVIHF